MTISGIKHSFMFKTISIVLIMAFSMYGTSFADAEKDALAPTLMSMGTPLSVEDVGIAIDAGTIKSKFSGDTGKVIIHIQDAHCNFEAQSNINKMLDQLTKECGINVISVEGAEGIVDTAWFKAFPDAEIRKEVATYFMKKGEITGAEFFSINSDYEGAIFGAETKEYYIKNLNAFTEVYPYKETIENYFVNTRTIANRLKLLVYPPELRELDLKMRAFNNKELELSEYAEYLFKAASKNKINMADYPNLKKLMETLEYEDKIDFDIVDTERTKYIDYLAKKLSKEQMTDLVTQSIRFKKGHIKAVNFYSFLRDLAKEHNIQLLQEYPNLFYYYIYTKIYDGIDNEGLFKEMDQVERDLKDNLFTDDTQRKLDKYSEMVDMFIDLANIELTNEDYDMFQEYSNEFSIDDVIVFYGSLVDKYNLSYTVDSVPLQINENIPKMITFYEVAMKRDTALIDNTLKYMEKEGNDRGVLIAGGFHTRGIKKILESKGISYVVVTPKITKDVETPYIKVLTNQRTSLEDIITESAAMPGATMSKSKERMTESVSDLLSPWLRVAQGTTVEDLPEGLRDALKEFKDEAFNEAVRLWLTKVKVNLVEDVKMSLAEADIEFNKFLEQDDLWNMLKAVYLSKYDDYLSSIGAQASAEDRARIADAFDAFRGKRIDTPGKQAAGGRVITPEEHTKYNEVSKEKFAERINMTDEERAAHEVKMDHIREGFVFQKHDGYVEALDEVGLPTNVHPSRGGAEFEHKLLQAQIDTEIYDSLTVEERDMVARHELAHIDIANGNEESQAWQLWVEVGKPVGQAQEDFVNDVLGYDVRAIAVKVDALAKERLEAMRAKEDNLAALEDLVANNQGVQEVIAITNGGDGKIVQDKFNEVKSAIFRQDGNVTIMSHEEVTRRGQFFGLLDAMEAWEAYHGGFNREKVSLGIMMPGKGTRNSPLVHREHGIKPNQKMLIKAGGQFLTGATASLYTWHLVAYNLERMGFRGIAWKWGDEPQIAANLLSEVNMDLTGADIVRFGSTVPVTDDLAENKEWLNASEDGTLVAQVRRRGRSELLNALGVENTSDAKAMVHIGSPAFSYDFIDAAKEAFKGVPNESWADVDGYLIEALTLKEKNADLTSEEKDDGVRTWESELMKEQLAKSTGMLEVLENVPDFYERVQNLKRILNEKRGKPVDAPLNIKVVDFGEKLAWFDIGQLSKSRESFYGVNRETADGEFARRVAGMQNIEKDEFGNRVVGDSYYPKDGSVRNSTLINTRIFGDEVNVDSAVLVDSDLGNVKAGKESVAYASTVADLTMGERSLSYKSVGEKVDLPSDSVHTSMPENPVAIEDIPRKGLENWVALMVDEEGNDINVGKGAYYNEPAFGNPRSFDAQREIVRRRSDEVSVDDIEKAIDDYARKPVLDGILAGADLKEYYATMFEPLKFGTSGLRDTVDHYEAGEFLRGKMTDMEVYINTRGFINFLREMGDINDTQTTIAVGGDLRASSPKIEAAVIKAITDEGLTPDFIADVPSPVLAYYAMQKGIPSVMVTGSHIPEDRNGIKYTKISGEVLKSDEKPILDNVQKMREQVYDDASNPDFTFDLAGKFKVSEKLPANFNTPDAVLMFINRYLFGLPKGFLEGRKVVIYQHSAVGRDIAWQIFEMLGAEVIVPAETVNISYIDEATGKEVTEEVSIRSTKFVPVDTEKITNKTQAVFNYLRDNYPADAYITFDGDTDRPLFMDENANFLPGDKLGALSAQFLKPDMVAIPVSANRKMVEDDLINNAGIEVKKTKVGSPHVIARVEKYLALPGNEDKRAMTWESNGGFLLMTPVAIEGAQETLKPLPTRDAMLPLILALQQSGEYASASEMIKQRLTPYETNAGVVDDKTPGAETYTAEMGQTIKSMFTPADINIAEVTFPLIGDAITAVDMDEEPYKIDEDTKQEIFKIKAELDKYFTPELGFTAPIVAINFMDGVQIVFDDDTVSHLRPSSNAPEFRNYALGENIDNAKEIADRRYKIVPAIIKGLEAGPETAPQRTTPGVYSVSRAELGPELTEVLRIPLVKGEEILATGADKYTYSVVLYENEDGDIIARDEVEMVSQDTRELPELLKARAHQVEVKNSQIAFTIPTGEKAPLSPAVEWQGFKGSTYDISEGEALYTMRNYGTEKAVVSLRYENTQREQAVYGILNLVKKHISAIQSHKTVVYVPSEMFYKGDDVGSLQWTEKVIKALAGDKIELKQYNAAMGLQELGGMGLDTNAGVVNVLIAADTHLKNSDELEKDGVEDFIKQVRPLPVPGKALNLSGDWNENGWDFSLETVGWALILGAVTPKQITDRQDLNSPAADMVKFMGSVLKKEVQRDYLFVMMPYNELSSLSGDITDGEVWDAINAGTISSWLNFLVNKLLFEMPIEPFNPTDQLRQRMKIMWSV